MQEDIFRKEALDHRANRLKGEVILRGPLSNWIITAILLAAAGLIICLVIFGTVETGQARVSILTFLLSLGGPS